MLQDGWEDVVHEIISNQATYGERAGITATGFTRFTALNTQHAQILAQIPQVEKAGQGGATGGSEGTGTGEAP